MLLLLIFSSILGLNNAMNYISSLVVDESLVLYENDILSLEDIDKGERSKLYMTIKKPITINDDLRLSVVAVRSDGVQFPIPVGPIKLCLLLELEASDPKGLIAQFRLSRIFNLENTVCPIPMGKRRLMPYMTPPKLRLENDLGCGKFIYHTTIESCGLNPHLCIPLISANITIYLSANKCSNYLM